MYKKYKKHLVISIFLIAFVFSLFYFNNYKVNDSTVLGSTLKSLYFMPLGSSYISQNKNFEGKEVLTFSTSLSEDQVKKFYSELLAINKNSPCVYNVNVIDEKKDLNIVKVTFCK